MRYIIKSDEPEPFIRWKRRYKNKNKRSATYDDLDKETKDIVKTSLISEQNGLCGYCCGMVMNDNVTIEHIRPRGVPKYSGLDMDYHNMMAACESKGKDCNCNAAKGDEFDEELFISPYDENCAEHFSFMPISGKIIPCNGDRYAEYMINLLNLNSEVLKNARITAYWTEEIMYMTEDELYAYIDSLEDSKCSKPYCDMLLYAAKEQLRVIKSK